MSKREQPETEDAERKRGRREQQQSGSVGPKTDSATKPSLPNVIELNVGGKVISTLRRTVTKEPDSMLTKMFSGNKDIDKDKDGRYFLDFDSEVFLHILNFLRHETLPPAEISLSVYSLAKKLNIMSLASKLENYHTVQHRKRIEELKIDAKKYERLKQDVLKEINNSNASPAENKLLFIFEKRSSTCSWCSGNDRFDFETRRDLSARILVQSVDNARTLENMKPKLISDLCEIGYAKHIDSKLTEDKCRSCDRPVNYLEIALFAN